MSYCTFSRVRLNLSDKKNIQINYSIILIYLYREMVDVAVFSNIILCICVTFGVCMYSLAGLLIVVLLWVCLQVSVM